MILVSSQKQSQIDFISCKYLYIDEVLIPFKSLLTFFYIVYIYIHLYMYKYIYILTYIGIYFLLETS